MAKEKREVWAFDLDATLAQYEEGDLDHYGTDHIGDPIPEGIEKVQQALHDGIEVFIFTARVTPFDDSFEEQLNASRAYGLILDWCKQHIGYMLPVTSQKLRCFTQIFDDRGREMVPNTGVLAVDLLGGDNGAPGGALNASAKGKS